MSGKRCAMPFRVGLIGAGSNGWGALAHVPAIAAAPSMTLHAVSATTQRSAEQAASAVGSSMAFGDWRELVRHPDIEVVSVSVRAPLHYDMVEAALTAGKAVYCEWPLANSPVASDKLAALARQVGAHTAIGLQARVSPWLLHVRDHLSSGIIGRPIAATMIVQDELSTGSISPGNAYMLDGASGANPFTIHGGHALDALASVVGEIERLVGHATTSRHHVIEKETGREVVATAPDQVGLVGTFGDGAIATVQIRAGAAHDRPLLLEILGTDALLRVTSCGYINWRPLVIERVAPDGTRTVLAGPPDTRQFADLDPGPAANVARAYESLAERMAGRETQIPDFGHAASLAVRMAQATDA